MKITISEEKEFEIAYNEMAKKIKTRKLVEVVICVSLALDYLKNAAHKQDEIPEYMVYNTLIMAINLIKKLEKLKIEDKRNILSYQTKINNIKSKLEELKKLGIQANKTR